MIRFDNVSVTFNRGTPLEMQALRGINLSISEGEFVTVIGSNGAGKSTLLNVLTGEARLQRGSIKVDEVNISNWSTARRASLIARVFQDPMIGTCSNLSIEENFAIAYRRGRRRGVAWALNKSIRSEFMKCVSTLGMKLEERLRDPIGMLSGGQRQAVSLLMAVMNPMKILVLDEHTAALDPKTAELVLKMTNQIVTERRLTTIMVTHSMHQALSVGTRTIMLHQGKIVLDVANQERKKLDSAALLAIFKKQTNSEDVYDDELILDKA